MGLSYHGTCYPTQSEAIEAFKSDYPLHQPANVLFLSAAVADGTAGVKFSTKSETGTPVIIDGVVQFATCDASTSGFSAIPVQSILFVLALFFAAVIGLHHGWNMKR